ncbi:MAG: hypothetical protein ACRYFS_24885 [Janthinobacterium lividum]
MTIDTRLTKMARIVFAISGLVMAMTPLVHADTLGVQSAAPKTVSADASGSTVVIVKLGNASLEEYQHGDPASRIQLLSNEKIDQQLATEAVDTYRL